MQDKTKNNLEKYERMIHNCLENEGKMKQILESVLNDLNGEITEAKEKEIMQNFIHELVIQKSARDEAAEIHRSLKKQ